ncbi:hypothetical protein G7A66_03165 [Altererythrobacter sp. SALINAS58]|uniref:potassium transporter TrkG n=1 Tax=Alteripontixanthobacter muriae TaxID=2705546 RepID=UPI001576C8BA|nr:potassium transporter TrkG [Alteripontixanthobacter muriae]NTZ42109.1 hypothetical protein [Alteripontixanthobacter muriae]
MNGLRDPIRQIPLLFLCAIAVGTLLLSLPFATSEGVRAPFLTALFTATSAVAVTGLIVVGTPTYWSMFGQVAILFMFQIGGFGIMTAATLFGLMVGRGVSLRDRMATQVERNRLETGDAASVLRLVFTVTIVVELAIAFILAIRMSGFHGMPIGEAAWHGIFHSVSAFNNAGFSTHSDNVMGYQTDPFILGPIMFSVVLVSLGFPVMQDIRANHLQWRRWALHTKLTVAGTGVPLRGIYDNMKTAVTTVFVGKERIFNRRFLVMADHYMVEPTACSPAAGWEKGQVENQVQTIRGRFFKPRLRFATLEELNGWLEAECLRWTEMQPHPEQKELTVGQALELERPALQPMLAPLDGFHETQHAVSGTCLISFDRNRYSVAAKAVRRAVQLRAYADRIVVRMGDDIIANHPRFFGRDRTIYDPWHYLPVLVNKPGALRNGAPFQDSDLPPALVRLRRKLGNDDDADRRFVRVLAAVLSDGLEAVESAVREALDIGAVSDEVILNILSRRREPPRTASIITPEDLALTHPPIANCARYDSLRGTHAAA